MESELFNFNEITKMSDMKIHNQIDSRGYSLLMITAEAGEIDAVCELIKRGEDVNYKSNGETAASLAFANQHYDVVVKLMEENSAFPHNFHNRHGNHALKKFLDLTINIHDNVKHFNLGNVRKHLFENPNLRHFYDMRNNSLLKASILCKNFEVYEVLLGSNMLLAPHESIEEIFIQLTEEDVKKLNEVNEKFSKSIFTNEMMTLLNNCRLYPEPPVGKQANCLYVLRQAFEFMFENPLIAIILKVVATSRNVKLMFDFNRSSTRFLDTDREPYINDIKYGSGKIYIGAKNMLDLDNLLTFISIIAHELSHYAIFLTFYNVGNPYRKKDFHAKKKFKTISQSLNGDELCDPCVVEVFEDYPRDLQNVELIARVPQMLVYYQTYPSKLEQIRQTHSQLFNYYEKKCVPAMENFIKNMEDNKKNNSCALFWLFSILVLCGLLCLGVLGFIFIQPALKWTDLSIDDKNYICKVALKFYDKNLTLCEIFGFNSNFFHSLKSEEIESLLSSNSAFLFIEDDKYSQHFSWSGMTDVLKQYFSEIEIYFQGKRVALQKFDNETLKLLDPNIVLDVFGGRVNSPFGNYFNIKRTKLESEWLFIENSLSIDRSFYNEYNKINANNPNLINMTALNKHLQQKKILLFEKSNEYFNTSTLNDFGSMLKKNFDTYSFMWMHYVSVEQNFEANYCLKNDTRAAKDYLINYFKQKFLKFNNYDFKMFKSFIERGKIVILWDVQIDSEIDENIIKCIEILGGYHVLLAHDEKFKTFKHDLTIYKKVFDEFIYKWNFLSSEEKFNIENFGFEFYGFNFRLIELFGSNSSLVNSLESNELEMLLKNDFTIIEQKAANMYSNLFYWNNLSTVTKEKFSSKVVNFQKINVSLENFDKGLLEALNVNILRVLNETENTFKVVSDAFELEGFTSRWIFTDSTTKIERSFYDKNFYAKNDPEKVKDSLAMTEILKTNRFILLLDSEALNSSVLPNFGYQIRRFSPFSTMWLRKIEFKNELLNCGEDKRILTESVPVKTDTKNLEIFKTFVEKAQVVYLWDVKNVKFNLERFNNCFNNTFLNKKGFHVILLNDKDLEPQMISKLNLTIYKLLFDEFPFTYSYLTSKDIKEITSTVFKDFYGIPMTLKNVTELNSNAFGNNFDYLKTLKPVIIKEMLKKNYSNVSNTLVKEFESKTINFQGHDMLIKEFAKQIFHDLSHFVVNIFKNELKDPFNVPFNLLETRNSPTRWFFENYATETGKSIINFKDAVAKLKQQRVLIFSNMNSSLLHNFGIQLRNEFHAKWIHYVKVQINKKFDFQNCYIQENNNGLLQNVKVDLAKYLNENFLHFKDENFTIFKSFFTSGSVVFLWDIAKNSTEYTQELISCVKFRTSNLHVIHAENTTLNFKNITVPTYKLILR